MKKTIFFTLLFTFLLLNNVYAENIFDAINNNDIESVKAFLNEPNADVDIKNAYGNTSLLSAARYGNLKIVELLIKGGANVNAQSDWGYTPLLWAAEKGLLDIAEILIKGGADVNAQNKWGNYTPLHVAAKNGHKDVAQLIINSGADVNVKNKYGMTPLHDAAYKGHLKITELLIKSGADVNVTGNDGDTPLHVALKWGRLDIAQLLIEGGTDVNVKNDDGYTPLHTAAYEGHQDIGQLLIESGANVNVKSEWGQTPLHKATAWGRKDIAQLLVTTPLLLQLEQDEDKADKKYKKVKYKLNLNKLNSEKKELLKKWFNRKSRESMFDLLMGKTDDKSNNEKVAPLLCVELIAGKLFETPFENPIELHNAKVFLKQCFINKDIVNDKNKLQYPGAQCFIEALYKNHLPRLKLYIDIKNRNNKTAIEVTYNNNIKNYLKNIQEANTYENLKNKLKNKIEYNYKKTICPEGLRVVLPLMNLEQLYEKSLLMGVN